jgi:hypothetical protein
MSLSDTVESVVFFYILNNLILGTILPESTTKSPEDISDSCLSKFMNKLFQYFAEYFKSTVTLKEAVLSI